LIFSRVSVDNHQQKYNGRKKSPDNWYFHCLQVQFRRVTYLPGANQGIGLGLARKFFEEGWQVFGSVRPETRKSSSLQDVSMRICFLSRNLRFITGEGNKGIHGMK
jgi:hypothetical protein